MSRKVVDIETNNLLNNMLDFSSLPYKLKPCASLWCVVVRDVDTGGVDVASLGEVTKEWMKGVLADCDVLIGHNMLKFDLPVLSLFGVLEYTVGCPKIDDLPEKPPTVFGKPVQLVDTLVLSRLTYPDRYAGHSLKAWGVSLNEHKGDYSDFSAWSEEMVDYCIQDTKVTAIIYSTLYSEISKCKKAFDMEQALASYGLNRELFGFKFDKELAIKTLDFLNVEMDRLEASVNPTLPPKKLNKGELKQWTPIKTQVLANGKVAAAFQKWCDARGIALDVEQKTIMFDGDVYCFSKEHPLTEPLVSTQPATIKDLDHVKSYLIELGWLPTEWKVRDLTKDSKKQPIPYEKRVKALQRWWDETMDGKYKELRFKELDMPPTERTFNKLLEDLEGKWPVRVPTSPCVRVGAEKSFCPSLESLGSKVDFAKEFVLFQTYKHRRSSIAGGDVDDIDLDEDQPSSGYLAQYRPEDGRIPTPAIEIGASTNRYKHIGVANIPKAESVLGEEMRSLFGCGDGYYQLGFDFSSLEARVQGSHIIPFGGEELAKTLVAEKPNDIHTINGKKLGIPRSVAKGITYAILYGSGAKKIATMLGISKAEGEDMLAAFWDSMLPLKELREAVKEYWMSTNKRYILACDGRKLFARSEHSLLNLLFQGNGVIAAKWTTVGMLRRAEEQGYCVSPLKGRPEIISMCEYHDEAQLAVSKELIEFCVGEDKDEMLLKKASVAGSSAMGIGGKKPFFCPPNKVSKIIQDSVAGACKELEFRVDLGIEWSVGRNWFETH